jgi:hypothetical protein
MTDTAAEQAVQGRRATAVEACRSCGGPRPCPFLSLGDTPIANALVDPTDGDQDPVHPLEVGFCPGCSLVQLTHELPADAIFGADYPYYSSVSDTLVAHAAEHVDTFVAERSLGPDPLVIEVGSNDGYLLGRALRHGLRVLGIDPSDGPASAARARGVPTLTAFFGRELAEEIRARSGPAELVVANNVMAHVPALNDFVAGLAVLVADDGLVQVENPDVGSLLANNAFDTVYHEHFCYFSTLAVEALFARHGLTLVDVRSFPGIHGGTLRWTASRWGRPSAAVRRRLARERDLGLADAAVYEAFGRQVPRIQADLRALLAGLRERGARIAAYGAAAKGATLLNSTGIDRTTVEYVVDGNVHKQGRAMPGARLPIRDPSVLLVDRPDHLLLLAWNLRDEVMRQQAEYRRLGGRFIVPVPTPAIVS